MNLYLSKQNKETKQSNNINFGANLLITNGYKVMLKRDMPNVFKQLDFIQDEFKKLTNKDPNGILEISNDKASISRNNKNSQISGQLSLACSYFQTGKKQILHSSFPLNEIPLGKTLTKDEFSHPQIQQDQILKHEIRNKYDKDEKTVQTVLYGLIKTHSTFQNK